MGGQGAAGRLGLFDFWVRAKDWRPSHDHYSRLTLSQIECLCYTWAVTYSHCGDGGVVTRDKDLREFLLALRKASLLVVSQIEQSDVKDQELREFVQIYRRASLLVVRQIEKRYGLKATE